MDENIQLLIDGINKIIDIDLNDDLNNGYNLLQLCNEYEQFKTYTKIDKCLKNNHKQNVILFINSIRLKYSILIQSYNFFNGYGSSNNSLDSCFSLQNYVSFLEKVKKLKSAYDKGKDGNELIKILKGENNE